MRIIANKVVSSTFSSLFCFEIYKPKRPKLNTANIIPNKEII
jgi:hypothetical protein